MKKLPKKARRKREKAEILLKNLAKALDACEKQNIHVKLQQGIVFSKYGYVLPFKKGWTVRMLIPGPYGDDNYDDLLDLPCLHAQVFPNFLEEFCGCYLDRFR